MSLQALLDRTALIAGGAAYAGQPGLYQGAGGITGVRRAWSKVPDRIGGTLEHVSFPPERWTIDYTDANGIRRAAYRIPLRLFVAKTGPGNIDALNVALPFVERYMAAYEAHGKLSDLSGANAAIASGIATLEGGTIAPYVFAGDEWLVLEFMLALTDKASVTLVA